MKLYTFIGSPNGHKVQAVIDALGLDVVVEYLDFAGDDLRGADYVALNPNAKTPTLIDGEFKLWESNAILQYLADKEGSGQLLPHDTTLRADVTRWQLWEAVHFNRAFGDLAFETVAKPRLQLGPTDEHLVSLAVADLTRFAPVLDQHMHGRRYLVGERLSIADFALLTFESYRDRVPFDWKPYTHINAYFDRLAKLDAWVRSAPEQIRAQRALAA